LKNKKVLLPRGLAGFETKKSVKRFVRKNDGIS